MERAPIETDIIFDGYKDVRAGIVKWPMSVIRLTAKAPERLVELADRILLSWRGYTDEKAMILAETDHTIRLLQLQDVVVKTLNLTWY